MSANQNKFAPDWLVEPKDANQMDAQIWPTSFVRSGAGDVSIGGVPVGQLATTYGTPLFVVDQDDFFARAKKVKSAFDDAAASIGSSAKIYYAGKSLLTTEVVKWVERLGLNVDVSSGGELALALAADINPARIGLHGNNKSCLLYTSDAADE
jgi:diaminopimelate decarboxylase